jgi:energy-coupling factor transport system permease protein
MTFHAGTLALYPFLLVLLALMTTHPLFLGMELVVIGVALWLAGGFGKFMRSVRFVVPLLLLFFVLNLLINKNGATVLYTGGPKFWVLGQLRITMEAMMFGLVMNLRMLAVLAAFGLYLSWLSGDRAFTLFAKWAGRSAVTTMLAARLISYLGEQSEQVRDVMKTRGVRFDEGGLWQRMNAHRPLLNVILISALEGSWSVAEAMEARGFGQGKRSGYHRERWSKVDLFAWLAMGIATLAMIILFFQGVLDYEFYPRLQPLGMDESGLWISLAVVALFLFVPPVLAKRRRS